jgi:ATP-binding cassette subfamily B protein
MSVHAPARGRRGRRAAEGPRASFRQLLPFLLEHKRTLVVVAVLSILGAGATLVQPLLVGEVISRVQESVPLGALVWLLVGFVVLSSLISGYQHYLLQRTGTAVVYSSRRRLIARILHLPISEFDARRTGDLVSRVGTDTTLLYAVLTQGLADAVGNALILVGAVVAMAFIDPLLLGLIVLVLGASIATVGILSTRIRAASAAQQTKVGELASGVERAVGSIRTIRAAGATDREATAVTRAATEAYDAGVRIAKVSALIVPVAGIALQVSLLVVLGVGGFRVASGAIDVAALVTFVIFLFLLVQPLASAIGAITSVNQALGALGRIQEVLDLPLEEDGDLHGPTEPRPEAAAIEFRDVRFRYPDHVLRAREAAAREARSVLAQAHLDRAADETVAEAEEGEREVLRGVSFTVARRPLRRGQEHGAVPRRTVLRPHRGRHPRRRR